ncbi:DUF3040 domain-containing protein [Streptomyces populi]
MTEGMDPSGDVRLSAHELLALSWIEAELRRDRSFARRMKGHPGRAWLPRSVVLLVTASACLAVAGICTSAPGVLWSFAVVWPLALVQSGRLLCRAVRDAGPRK